MTQLTVGGQVPFKETYPGKVLEKFGDIGAKAIPISIGACALLSGRVSEFVVGCASVYLQEIEIGAIKRFFPRDRPEPYHRGKISRQDHESFPSAHAAGAFMGVGLAYGLYGLTSPITITAIATASLVGLSRYTSKKHWATDVLAGAVIGGIHGVVAGNFRAIVGL